MGCSTAPIVQTVDFEMPRSKLTHADVELIRKSDARVKDLAMFYGVADSTISNAKNGITWRKTPGKKHNNKRAKLTPEQVAWVRENVDGITQRYMANMLRVSQGAISHIINYRSWRWLK